MKKQQRTIGAIVKIDLGNGFFNYAQILKQDIAFFDIYVKDELKNLNILMDKPVLFFLGVYNDVITSGRWGKIGMLLIRKEFESTPNKYIQDALNPNKFELYITDTGEIAPSSKEKCKGLECAAVWEAEHVEERLRDHFSGRPNKYVQECLKAFE